MDATTQLLLSDWTRTQMDAWLLESAIDTEDLERATRPLPEVDWRWEQLDEFWRECDDLRDYAVQF